MKERRANLDEARMLANVRERAQRLFEDGYRANTLDSGLVEIYSPGGADYDIDRKRKTCSCPFFVRISQVKPVGDPDCTCKHLLGLAKLFSAQKRQAQQLQIQRHNLIQWEALV
ncbi:MAG: hypothetical protein QM758_13780 [Armatimonas sp.]